MLFEKPTQDMVKHLKPLFIKASINENMFRHVFVANGIVLNFMPHITLKNLGKNMEDLIPTNMKMEIVEGMASIELQNLVIYLLYIDENL